MKIKRVLLIDPPVTRPLDMTADKVRIGLVAPLGLAYIGAVLEQNGIEVQILDCVAEGQRVGIKLANGEVRYGMTDADILSAISLSNPDLVGVSCLFSNKAWDAHNVCAIVKEYNKDVIIVMGGTHPSALPDETLKDKNIDAVILGEGEKSMLRVIDIFKMGWNIGRLFSSQPIANLDNNPFPARYLLNMQKYMYGESPHSGLKRVPVANIMTSRGCPSRCNFCAIRCMWGEKYRMRSPENVLVEIEQLINTYGIKELHFEDDCLTANKKRAMAIFQGIIDRKFDLTLNSPSGLAIFAMDEELLDKMREAGYYSISLAIESGVPEVLTLMNKRVNLIKAKRLIAYARSLGMKTKAFFILGYPGETKETMKRTVDCAGTLGADWVLFFPATNLPGTEMDKIVRQNGWLVDPDMDYRYYFYRANIRTPEFDPDYVMNLREDANRQINFENNYNMGMGNYRKAIDDFSEIVNLYPNLQMARDALRLARKGLNELS